MNGTIRLCVVSGLALMIGAGAALADSQTDSKRRKQGLFSSLFGESNGVRVERDKRKKKRTLFGRGDNWDERGAWLNRTQNGVRIINGQEADISRRQSNVVVADEDPEGDPGFGMGNLPYVQPKLVALTGQKLTEPRPLEVSSGAIYDALAATENPDRVLPEIRDALAAHYIQQKFKPVWLDGQKLSARGSAVLKLLSAASEDGLEPESFRPAVLSAFDAPLPEQDAAAMARLDIELTAAAILYARDASGGQFDPRRLSLYNDVTPEWVKATAAVKVLGWSPYPAEYLRSLHPSHPAYAAMKAELAKLRAEQSTSAFTPIEDGDIVKKGKTDPRIPAVRQRLADLGYPEALAATGEPEVLDAELSIQLRLFQKASGIKVSGALGPQTVAALNTDMSGRDMARLLNNMERLRWLPKSLGTRHVFVNQAAFEARVMDKGQEVWSTKVIVGKPFTQTSVFHDEMETVVFNPSWGVPPSIIANEYLPKLRRDPGYLDRIGFKVVNEKGKVVSSRSVSWASYGSKVPFGIQQPPGAKNALGEVKFLFPNSHNIYMHDTPNRELFDNDVRAFSHGCVRVQNPRRFAEVILGWDAEEVAAHIGTKGSETIRLPEKVPVHLTYFTAWPDAAGKIQYFNDIYGRDKSLEAARSATVLAQR